MKILFIGNENTAWSGLAEGLARCLYPHPELEFCSAGTQSAVGEHLNPYATRVLRRLGYDASPHRSRALSLDLLEWADHIWTVSHHERIITHSAFYRGLHIEKVAMLAPEFDLYPATPSDEVYEKYAQRMQVALKVGMEKLAPALRPRTDYPLIEMKVELHEGKPEWKWCSMLEAAQYWNNDYIKVSLGRNVIERVGALPRLINKKDEADITERADSMDGDK
jgi:protein-tyrosine-phosphatase